jgi:hypothetical protein
VVKDLRQFLTYVVVVLFVLAALTYGLCAIVIWSQSESYPEITPVGLVLVPAGDVPSEASYGPPTGGPALRIDFRAQEQLAGKDRHPTLDTRFCKDKENPWWEIWAGQIYVGRSLLSDLSSPLSSQTTYSGYFPTSFAGTPSSPAINDRPYDLTEQPRPLCIWVDYGTDAFNSRRTNEIRFTAAQVAAALRASH